MDFLQYWGYWIQSERKANGYSLEDFAKLTQLSLNQIYNIEKGQGDSRKDTLERILSVLGDDKAYDVVLSYVELNIEDFIPLIQSLEQLDPEERYNRIQQILSILS